MNRPPVTRLAEWLAETRFVLWIVCDVLWPIQCALGFHHAWGIWSDTDSSWQCWRCGKEL